MVRAHGGKRDNVCGRIHSALVKGGIIPSKEFRRGKHLPCTANPGGYITVYPQNVGRLERKWQKPVSRCSDTGSTYGLFSKAHSFGCDKQGRINLNDKLLEHADIQARLCWLGTSAFAIWSEGRYASRSLRIKGTFLMR